MPVPRFKVFLDSGHSGPDSGAIGIEGIKEKDYTLRLVLSLKNKLTILAPSWEVNTTFLTDPVKKITPGARARIANQWQATFFLSIHLNSNEGAPGTGSEVWSVKRRLDDADILSDIIATAIGLKDRGGKATVPNPKYIKGSDLPEEKYKYKVVNSIGEIVGGRQERIGVLYQTKMPAFLIEPAFINNFGDIAALEANWDALVELIARWLVTATLKREEP